MNRDQSLLDIRPIVSTIINQETTPTEAFQNSTLRPILKFQNDLIIYLFKLAKPLQNINFDKKDKIGKKTIITDLMKSNHKLKDQIEACIIAQMVQSELDYYFCNRSEMKRRINTMVIKRLIDNLV